MFERKIHPVEGVDGAYIASWSGLDRADWDDALSDARSPSGHARVGTLKLACVALSVVTADGKRLYPTTQRQDLVRLGNAYSPEELDTLFRAASDLNKVMSTQDAVEVAEGN